MILGISASGREDRVTEHAGRSVSGCRACLGCARDSFCRYEDDWLEIGRAMLEADAMVFGAPAYYGTMNAHEQGSLMPPCSGSRFSGIHEHQLGNGRLQEHRLL
jgi:hypothetical protein